MARRVNKMFVAGLGSVMLVGAGGVALLVHRGYFDTHDPVKLTTMGQEEEKKGDLVSAAKFYARAADAAARQHAPDAAARWELAGNTAYKLSEQETNPDQSNSYYATAMGYWNAALVQDARYLPVLERELEEEHDLARTTGAAQQWARLRDVAGRTITAQPTFAKAYAYRAEAALRQIEQTGASGVTQKDAEAAQADATKALQLDKDNDLAASASVELKLVLLQAQPDKDAQAKARDGAIDEAKAYLKDHPAASRVSIELAQALLMGGDRAGAVAALEAAVEKDPGNLDLAAVMATQYRNDAAKAETLYKNALAASPEKATAYRLLAMFYEEQNRRDDAIATWKLVLENPRKTGGRAAFMTQLQSIDATTSIAWLYMDAAEQAGPSTTAGKEALAQAADYTDKLRAAHAASGLEDLLDGRMSLLHMALPQAVQSLKRAQASLGTPNTRTWLWTKMTLAKAYDMQQEWGLAKSTLDEVLTAYPTYIAARLSRAREMVRMGQDNGALGELEPLLKTDNLPTALKNAAQEIEAQAYAGLGDTQRVTALYSGVGSTDALLQLARTRLQAQDADGAMEEVDAVLKKDPTNMSALYLGVLAASQANKKDLAADYVARGLKQEPDNTQFKLMDAALKNAGGDVKAAQQKVLEAITDPVTRDMALAQMHVTQGEMDKAIALYQSAEKAVETAGDAAPAGAMSDVVDHLFAIAVQQAEATSDKDERAKYLALAEQYVQKAERLDLDGAKGQFYRGRLQLAEGGDMAKQAVGTLEQAVAARPDISTGHAFLGTAYAAQTPPRVDVAIDQFRQALQQKPDNLMALRSAIILLLQKPDAASQKEAVDDYQIALQYYPHDKVLVGLGDVLGDPAEAIRKREALRKSDPGNEENLRRLALLYSRGNQPAKAIEVLRPVFDKKPDLQTANFLAQMYINGQQPDEGLKLYDSFVNSSDPAVKMQALLMKGQAYRLMGNGDQAVATFQAAQASEPKGQDEAERLLADYYFETGDTAKAEPLYQQVEDRTKGGDLKVSYRLAETLIREGKFKQADALLALVLSKQSQDAKALVLQAMGMLSQSRPADARKVLEGLLGREPNNTDALFYHASCLLALNSDLDVAARDLLAVRDSKTGSGATVEGQLNSRLLLARVLRQARRYTDCAAAYEEAINRLPSVPSIRVVYAQYLLWVLGVEQKLSPADMSTVAFNVRQVKAEARMRALLDNSEKAYPNAPVWQVLGAELDAAKGDLAAAKEKLAAVYQTANGDLSTSVAYLEVLLQVKDYPTAISVATKELATHDGNTDLLLKRAAAYGGAGKASEAAADFNLALAAVGKNVDASMAVESVALQTLGASATGDMLKTRAAAHPDEVGTRAACGDALVKADRGAEAVPVLAGLLADPKAEAAYSLAQHQIGIAKYQAKDFQGAYEAYMAVLKNEPNDAQTLNNLAYMLTEDMHKPADGLTYADRAVKALQEGGPEGLVLTQGDVLDTYGWAKYRTGDKEGAISELKRAADMQGLPETYLHLAKVYKDVGRMSEAKKAVDEGIRVAGGSSDPAVTELEGMKKELGS